MTFSTQHALETHVSLHELNDDERVGSSREQGGLVSSGSATFVADTARDRAGSDFTPTHGIGNPY